MEKESESGDGQERCGMRAASEEGDGRRYEMKILFEVAARNTMQLDVALKSQ